MSRTRRFLGGGGVCVGHQDGAGVVGARRRRSAGRERDSDIGRTNLMSRPRRFLGGAGFGYANQVVVTLAGLWLVPFLLARTGQHDYGLWLVGTQVLAYLALMDFGVVA